MIKSDNGKVYLEGSLENLLSDVRMVLQAMYEQHNKNFEAFCDNFFFTLNPKYGIEEVRKKTDKKFEELRKRS